MKKINKLISLFAALCMIISMISGLTVFAEDANNESLAFYWDADNDFVSVDFEEAITDVNSITLTHGSKTVDAVVEYSKHKAYTDDIESRLDTSGMTRYTYLIKPANNEKIKFDEVYTLNLQNVTGAKTGKTVTASVRFMVKKLSESTEINDTNWKLGKTGNAQHTFNNTSGNIQLNVATTDHMTLMNFMGKSSVDTSLKDYTVKITYSDLNASKKYDLKLGALSESGTYHISDAGYNGVYMNVITAANADVKYVYLVQNYYDYTGRTQDTQRNLASTVYSNYWLPSSESSEMSFKISTKDDFARAYLNDIKVGDLALWTDDAKKSSGIVGIQARVANAGDAPATIKTKDFLVTQAVDLSAATAISPAGWDADNDFITLDYKTKVDEDLLQSAVTVKKDGAIIPVTVKEDVHADSSNIVMDRHTYIIKPADGSKIDFDTLYELSVDSVLSTDSAYVLLDYNKKFKVEKLAEGTTLSDKQWSKYQTKDGEGAVTQLSDGAINIKWDKTNAGYTVLGTKAGASSFDTTAKDYTVKITYSDFSAPECAELNLVSHIGNTSYCHGQLGLQGIYLNFQYFPSGSRLTFAEQYNYAGNTKEEIIKQSSYNKYTDAGFGTSEGAELKISAKDGFAKAFLNSSKVADITLVNYTKTGALPAGFAGVHPKPTDGSALSNDWTNGTTMNIKNFLMTKAVEVTDYFNIGEVVVTADGEAVNTIAGHATVDVEIPVINFNSANASKDIYIVCAFYKDTDEMTNCYVSSIKSVDANDTANISFANAQVNGGTKLKLFFWDGIDTLVPYFTNLIFPSPVDAE